MLDDYQIPACALLGTLILAFWYLHRRVRSVRTLLWLLGMVFAELHAVLFWRVTMTGRSLIPWPFRGSLSPASPWMNVVSETAMMVASALFLASLSPLTFRLGRRRVLFVLPYIAPLLAYTILYYGFAPHPMGWMLGVYLGLAACTISVAAIWSLNDGVIPIWLAELVVGAAALGCAYFYAHGDVLWPLRIGISGNLLMTALLVVYTFRRATPGVFLTTIGFVVWAVPPFMGIENAPIDGSAGVSLARAWILSKVLLAVGLLLLVMEDEIERNQSAGRRELRVRRELEAYARQHLTARSLEKFDDQASGTCALVAEFSRFSRVALVMRGRSGGYSLVGSAGMDRASTMALEAVVEELPRECFSGAMPELIAGGGAGIFDLKPWLKPGDDLEQIRLTEFAAILLGATEGDVDGALLLAGQRASADPLTADDLLSVQILAGRIRSARTQSLTMGKLIDAERSNGVGRLAIHLAQELHNPLTVVLGYAALLDEMIANGVERRAAEGILLEARRMRAVLDRLALFSRHQTERYSAFSLPEVMLDLEQFHRADFLRESIEFNCRIAPDIPRLYGNQHRIRQALMHVMQYAIDTVGRQRGDEQKSIRVAANSQSDRVRVEFSHSGAWLAHPEQIFDALGSGFPADVVAGIGLSLCAEILREYGGTVAAENLNPLGVTILVVLPVRETPPRA